MHVGVVGMGGLGIMGIKLAKQMGCRVTAISRSTAKKDLSNEFGLLETEGLAKRIKTPIFLVEDMVKVKSFGFAG